MGKGAALSDVTALRKRQWVSIPGGSCDVRLGTSVLDEASSVLKGCVGSPRAAALLAQDGVDADACELMRRQLTDAGFAVTQAVVPFEGQARMPEACADTFSQLASAGITSDDVVVAMGGVDALSMASYVCAQWCGGVALVMVPTSLTAFVEAPVTPRGIDVVGRPMMLSLKPWVKQVLFDVDLAMPHELCEDVLMARVHMVVTAMCDSESTFSHLWDRTEGICAFDPELTCEQLQDTIKTRGKTLSSTALALRQSLAYGEAFARALQSLLGAEVAPSVARAEALRFQARLAAGEGMFEVDDVLAQDELLGRLEVPVLTAHVDPNELMAALRAERFLRTNRFLLGLPRKLGRVRLASVTDELIAEHVAAWCASRAAAN